MLTLCEVNMNGHCPKKQSPFVDKSSSQWGFIWGSGICNLTHSSGSRKRNTWNDVALHNLLFSFLLTQSHPKLSTFQSPRRQLDKRRFTHFPPSYPLCAKVAHGQAGGKCWLARRSTLSYELIYEYFQETLSWLVGASHREIICA